MEFYNNRDLIIEVLIEIHTGIDLVFIHGATGFRWILKFPKHSRKIFADASS